MDNYNVCRGKIDEYSQEVSLLASLTSPHACFPPLPSVFSFPHLNCLSRFSGSESMVAVPGQTRSSCHQVGPGLHGCFGVGCQGHRQRPSPPPPPRHSFIALPAHNCCHCYISVLFRNLEGNCKWSNYYHFYTSFKLYMQWYSPTSSLLSAKYNVSKSAHYYNDIFTVNTIIPSHVKMMQSQNLASGL